MALFTHKTRQSGTFALIGEVIDNGDIIWNTADYEYCIGLLEDKVLEDRGYKTVNDIYYRLFYLPPPGPH